MSNQAFRIQSNRAVHGVKFAFDQEFKRLRKTGCSENHAFAIAAQLVFGRFVKGA